MAVKKKGGSFLEAPVSGSKKPAEAEDGQLVILSAGDKGLYDAILSAFDVLGKKYFFLGEVGNGANMKLIIFIDYVYEFDMCKSVLNNL
ncbi:putative 6-phosphogluconate dehydrogenase, NADP-binding, NAD(P)-binding domain superfamily [Helianthus annuus]|uniref:6-phosphogluconate dehydrogenase, NADP-binding, NAD(P)-binding domain superfamily n=1 Tax=Helianthus annuus TaxID=4232 RepID=A0A9K3DTV7_HELAN|nr:glyoxylate/succinic semialdehyde reductase 1-like [Helianthus annuus]KAF5761520.1 putative 6-phosphogluconate dehydrogenase, NADP-binding, NAD(P)-binding domain superfamily [Helianthus annuus]KAJ0439362.1 putative 6-phosphogluconate dehydrogenase, NADP-binding, NAD(P)-binding domain superfamily [Helianthus annuus]KAJ0461709.1 putative 6-phosphogluconate dehydrogenase, NADP-binding, NAD(P)-binding domain superfamily [Helianthus annuus]KAJ0645998.1 putative 6-phosphogluconate dehydrogenase, NA